MRGKRGHGTAESGATERNRGAGRASRRGRRSCQVGPVCQRTGRHAALTRWDCGAASGRAVRRAGRAGQAGARRTGEPCVACGPNGRRRARAWAALAAELGRSGMRGLGRMERETAGWASSWVGFFLFFFSSSIYISNSNQTI